MAEFNQGLAKDMWWYTSTNQVKALKEQGLNPALMYGKGGGGGGSAEGAGAAGVSAAANKANAETFAKRLTEEVKKWGKELSQKDTQILQDWIFKSVHSMAELTNAGANVIDSVIPF